MNGLPKILYDNRLFDAAPVASSTAVGTFNVLNLVDWRPYTWWKPSAMPATITVDCGSAKAADYCAVYGHDLNTQGSTLEVRGSTDNFGGSDVLVASLTPTTDKPLLLQWASVAYRYWRVRLTGATAPSLAIVAIGAALQMPRRLKAGFDPIGHKPVGLFSRSEKGHPLGMVVSFKDWSETLSFNNLDSAWMRSTWVPAWDAHLGQLPWLLAWDPVDHAEELRLVVASAGFKAGQKVGPFVDLSFDVTGIIP